MEPAPAAVWRARDGDPDPEPLGPVLEPRPAPTTLARVVADEPSVPVEPEPAPVTLTNVVADVPSVPVEPEPAPATLVRVVADVPSVPVEPDPAPVTLVRVVAEDPVTPPEGAGATAIVAECGLLVVPVMVNSPGSSDAAAKSRCAE